MMSHILPIRISQDSQRLIGSNRYQGYEARHSLPTSLRALPRRKIFVNMLVTLGFVLFLVVALAAQPKDKGLLDLRTYNSYGCY